MSEMARDTSHVSQEPIGDDLLRGAKQIADFLKVKERTVYHLIDTEQIPFFKLGGRVCARRSSLARHIEALENERTAHDA